MKRILINATQPEEIRVALVDSQYLYNLDIQSTSRIETKANIYKGKIARLEASLEAAFVNYGAERHGFLPFKEIAEEYYAGGTSESRLQNIKEQLKEGSEILVQIEKEERGNKGAALTTYVSLAGCYLVLMPNNPEAGGVSRRIEQEDRKELKETLSQLKIPPNTGVIVRTAGVGKSTEELQWDLDSLLKQWKMIQEAATQKVAPFLIHREGDIITRCIRDNLMDDINEILIDNEKIYDSVKSYVRMLRPDFESKVLLYQDVIPLFSRYQVEKQIESALQHEIILPSGGSIVIDHTEALTAIDVNSAKATRGGDIEDTALQTNLEAVNEVARQLRMRDLGGLIVVDFIDMTPIRNQRAVEDRFHESVKIDRARIQLGRISRFGLMELSRQRLRPSLREGTQHVCPRCSGHGTIRNAESLALSILRLSEEEALKEKGSQIRIHAPLEVATFLLNEKKINILNIEKHHEVEIFIIPSTKLETPHFKIERVRSHELNVEKKLTSYEIELETEAKVSSLVSRAVPEEAAVQTIVRAQAPSGTPRSLPNRKAPARKSLINTLLNLFSKKGKEPEEISAPLETPKRRYRTGNNRRRYYSRGKRSQGN